jgi:hypothetical protein
MYIASRIRKGEDITASTLEVDGGVVFSSLDPKGRGDGGGWLWEGRRHAKVLFSCIVFILEPIRWHWRAEGEKYIHHARFGLHIRLSAPYFLLVTCCRLPVPEYEATMTEVDSSVSGFPSHTMLCRVYVAWSMQCFRVGLTRFLTPHLEYIPFPSQPFCIRRRCMQGPSAGGSDFRGCG